MNLRKYIGRPYEKYNCFDLVKEFYIDNFSLDLSDYFSGGPVPDREECETLIVSTKGDFVKVDVPKVGDIVVIKLYGLECHVGVFVGCGQFIHSTKTVGSNMDKITRYSNLIAGYYRHRDRQ